MANEVPILTRLPFPETSFQIHCQTYCAKIPNYRTLILQIKQKQFRTVCRINVVAPYKVSKRAEEKFNNWPRESRIENPIGAGCAFELLDFRRRRGIFLAAKRLATWELN